MPFSRQSSFFSDSILVVSSAAFSSFTQKPPMQRLITSHFPESSWSTIWFKWFDPTRINLGPGFGIALEENMLVVLNGLSNIKNQTKIVYSTVFYINKETCLNQMRFCLRF
jgi:hypothetical protein